MKHIRVPLYNRSIFLKRTGLTGSKKTDLKLESATVQQSNSQWLVCADDGRELEFSLASHIPFYRAWDVSSVTHLLYQEALPRFQTACEW